MHLHWSTLSPNTQSEIKAQAFQHCASMYSQSISQTVTGLADMGVTKSDLSAQLWQALQYTLTEKFEGMRSRQVANAVYA